VPDANTRRQRVLVILSLVIGITTGLTVVAFILLTGRLAARMYPGDASAWRRLLIPTGGALISGWLLYRFFPGARGSGIPQTKFALFLEDGYISLKTVLGKLLCCSVSLSSGIALGREGPSVQIGAGIASVIGRRFGLKPAEVKSLVPVGASAALAAAFNTPIAAVLFSLEEILGDLHAPVLGSVVLSSAASWMVLHLFLGDQPLFHVPAYQLVSPAEFPIYAVLGLAGGIASVAFVKLLLVIRLWFRSLPVSTIWLQPVAGGLLVGVLGWFVPEVLGVGYDYVDRVLGGDIPLKTVALLAVLKLIATPACYSSGNAGGIFGPSLFLGAMTGGVVGSLAHSAFPGITGSPGAYALVGMGATFAGIIRTPLTSVIMIFEMTRDYSIIVPLMIANLASFIVSRLLQPEPIYEALAMQEGVYLPTAEAREASGVLASEIMRESPPALTPDSTVAEALVLLDGEESDSWPVIDEKGLRGTITRAELTDLSPAHPLVSLLPKPPSFPYAHPDHSATQALDRMRAAQVDVLPVVSRSDVRHMLGLVTLRGILNAYGVRS
jgi:CIC family chloride channel protein